MASGEALDHGARMRTAIGGAPRRETDNELYDRACDLVEAADAIRRLAGEPNAVQAVPAVLGCMHDAIGNLNLACVGLEQTVAEAARARGPEDDDRWRRRVIDRMHRGFENLSAALEDTQQATGACRALVARALAVASGEHRRRARR
jgi:hypothetical protein